MVSIVTYEFVRYAKDRRVLQVSYEYDCRNAYVCVPWYEVFASDVVVENAVRLGVRASFFWNHLYELYGGQGLLAT